MSMKRWIARRLAPEEFLTAERYRKLRGDIADDRWWLASDFPEIAAFCERLLANDVNHWRGLDDEYLSSPWRSEISAFREQLRAAKARS
jgi:hypothetical protein